jgi:hypothetical protein
MHKKPIVRSVDCTCWRAMHYIFDDGGAYPARDMSAIAIEARIARMTTIAIQRIINLPKGE